MIAWDEINVAKAERVSESFYSGKWCIAKASSFVPKTGKIFLGVPNVKASFLPFVLHEPSFPT